MKNQKCKSAGCYEPCDCRHGFCAAHCCADHRLRDHTVNKTPKTSIPHIGVEIEVQYGDAHSFRRGTAIGAHRDGSLGSYGAEYKVLAPSTKIIKKAGLLLDELWVRRATVPPSCGIHVHIDIRHVQYDRLYKLFDWFAATEDVWFDMMPPSRRDNNYVHRFDPFVRAEYSTTSTSRRNSLNRFAVSPQYIPTDHYVWAHKTRYNTIEVRIHGATLNSHKLTGWLSAMIHIQKKVMDLTYTFPTVGKSARVYCGDCVDESVYLSDTVEVDKLAARKCLLSLFRDAPVAREYLATRINYNGILRDVARQTIEA